jgi:hypothetical protein
MDGDPSRSAGHSSTPPVINVRVRMSIVPWTDVDFVHAVENAWVQVSLCPDIESSSLAAAAMAESLLRESGFPGACVIDCRTIDEALRHVAHWQVVRDGLRNVTH